MSYRPSVDELLADSLIQAVMRADHVEPQALRALLKGAAGRLAAGPGRAPQPSRVQFVGSASDRRTTLRGTNTPPARHARVPRGTSGPVLCCC